MAVYLFKCSAGHSFESPFNTTTMCPSHFKTEVNRDWRAEAVGIGSGVRVSRTGTDTYQRDLFLPSAADYKGPDDPDGSKGIKKWAEEHQPKEGKALYPDIPRSSY